MVQIFFAGAIGGPTLIGLASIWFSSALWGFVVIGPLIVLGLQDVIQSKHALLRIYPVIGHG